MRPDDAAPQPAGGGLPADPAAYFRQLGEQTSQVLAAAEGAAQAIREQARKDAAGIIAEARMRAEEVGRAAAAQRRAAEEELRRFRAARTILANQIEDVHRRLEEVILRLKTPVEAPDTGRPEPVQAAAKAPAGAERVAPEPVASEPVASEPVSSEPVSSEPLAALGGEAVPVPEPEPEVTPVAVPEPVGAGGEAAGGEAGGGEAGGADTPAGEVVTAAVEEAIEELAVLAPPELEVEANGQAQLEEVAVAVVVEVADVEVVEVAGAEPDPAPAAPPEAEPELETHGAPLEEREGFASRREALGDAPLLAARSLKRLLQEDQNDLLDRIRRHRGRGTFEADILPAPVQVDRFVAGLRGVLEPAFRSGRRLGGAPTLGDPANSVAGLVAKQVVAPLRRDLARMIEPRLAAGDTATTVSERAGDVYRVWKGVRTELLGEGLAYAAFHHGLLDAWREANGPAKRWVLSPEEADCPRDVCRTNAAAGAVAVDASFPSGHLAPPAHGACTCTVIAARV